MAQHSTSEDTTVAEGEGGEGSDKPIRGNPAKTSTPAEMKTAQSNNSAKDTAKHVQTNTTSLSLSNHLSNIPLPPPEAGAYEKQPGHTRGTLEKLVLSTSNDDKNNKKTQQIEHRSPSMSPSVSDSTPSSPATRPPSTRPPSLPPTQPSSRRPSMSGSKAQSSANTSTTIVPTKAGKPASVHSDTGGHKFNLKDLLAATPKLPRRASQRSTGSRSSRRSDSDAGSDSGKPGKSKSNAGESTTSLGKKYGVLQKMAIGKGATSVVRLAHKWDRSEEKLYAVKEFRKRRKNESEKEYVKKLTAEFCISSTLRHPNIVETVDLIQDENHAWCEVMEFCPGGDLYAAIKKGGMSPSEVECCFKQILNGVQYLHSQGVAHRDIKPENLFFDTKGHIKIGDYGASTVYRLPWEATIHMSTGLCGSEPYIAPEQFLG
jgi:protein-serine/threonine kinase